MAVAAQSSLVLCLLLPPPLIAAEYVQKQAGGKAVVRMNVERLDGDAAVFALSREVKLTIALEGPPPLALVGDQQQLLDRIEHDLAIVSIDKAYLTMGRKGPQVRTLQDGKQRWEVEYTLEPRPPGTAGRESSSSDPQVLGKGSLRLPPLSFTDGASVGPVQVTWQPIPIIFTTVVENPDDLSPAQLKDSHRPENPDVPYHVPLWRKVVLITALSMLVSSLAATAVLYYRWRRVQTSLPPGEWARRELALLEAKHLPEAGQVERFHTELSDIVRNYLERQFRLRAPQQTTAEFLTAMQSWPLLPAAQQQTLRTFLERCDLVKFAKMSATPDECQATLAMARELVEYAVPACGVA